MIITLANGATTLTLPEDMSWVDEFAWGVVAQKITYSVTGSAVIESKAKKTGQPVTLQGGDDFAWISRSTLATLKTWRATAGLVMVLTIDGVARNVIFDHEKDVIEAKPVFFFSDPQASDNYVVTLRFITV